MKRPLLASLVSTLLLSVSPLVLAQSPPRDAGAAADEAFSPGPGGGEPDAGSKRPPLESTGMEDTDFGCSCRTSASRSNPAWGVLAVGLAAGALVRRRRAHRATH